MHSYIYIYTKHHTYPTDSIFFGDYIPYPPRAVRFWLVSAHRHASISISICICSGCTDTTDTHTPRWPTIAADFCRIFLFNYKRKQEGCSTVFSLSICRGIYTFSGGWVVFFFFFLGWPRVARGGLGWLRVAEPGGAILLPAALVVAACDELVLFIRLQT